MSLGFVGGQQEVWRSNARPDRIKGEMRLWRQAQKGRDSAPASHGSISIAASKPTLG